MLMSLYVMKKPSHHLDKPVRFCHTACHWWEVFVQFKPHILLKVLHVTIYFAVNCFHCWWDFSPHAWRVVSFQFKLPFCWEKLLSEYDENCLMTLCQRMQSFSWLYAILGILRYCLLWKFRSNSLFYNYVCFHLNVLARTHKDFNFSI